jgi:hypothetical protein
LNYVGQPEDLTLVFQRVAVHLRSRGLFLFDVLDERAMRLAAKHDFHHTKNGACFVMCTDYDERLVRETTRVVFADGVEEHVRVPLERHHIESAAQGSGFTMLEAFRAVDGFRSFYVLRRAPSG